MPTIVAVITVEVLVAHPVLAAIAGNNTRRHVVFVMAQDLAILVAVMAGLVLWVWAKTIIAHLAETTTEGVRLVTAAEHGKNEYQPIVNDL